MRHWHWQKIVSIVALAVLVSASAARAAFDPNAPTADEKTRQHQWTTERFDKDGPPVQGSARPAIAGLEVLANNDAVQKNARNGKPMKIGEVQYARGLYCHASSHIVVHLPGRGAKFVAAVGVDSNEQTAGGKGSVVATVTANGKEAFRSEVLREGMAAVPVAVELGGATEFILKFDDAGDGINADQADWADARVELQNGEQIWLADLAEPRRAVGPLGQQPFSFVYNGRHSAELLPTWNVERSNQKLDEHRAQRTLAWTDPQSGLVVRCVAVEYADFPTVEWTLHFKNTGSKDSPVLEDIQAMDFTVERGASSAPAADFVLHHSTGTPVTATDYQPHEKRLTAGAPVFIRALNGRPTNHELPNFNIAWGEGSTGLGAVPARSKDTGEPPVPRAEGQGGQGFIAVLGWPGNWSSSLECIGDNSVRVRGGQGQVRLVLHPGEEVRSPIAVVQFYDGDWIRGQNVWRRWMIAHNVPRPGGKLPPPAFTPCSSHQFREMEMASEESQKLFIDRYIEEGLKPDYWWMDAGWYFQDKGWTQTGTWKVDKRRFPNGLRPISDYAHSKGVKTIVWFEPERVAPATELYDEHRDWVHKGGSGDLLKLGEPKVRKWITDRVDSIITEQGIDLYRQDFNMDPLPSWRSADSSERQGMTEIRHVEGYLGYWDELRRRHPNMLIDSCASGGCRNDLETLRRAVPLLRSDAIMDPIHQQNHTYGCALWIPYFGTGIGGTDAYTFRSQMTLNLIGVWDMRNKSIDYETLRKLLGQWRAVNANYFGDYYPLTPYAPGDDAWMAWQFDRPETGAGMVQAFRRPKNTVESLTLKLRGLDPAATYKVIDLDGGDPVTSTGKELMGAGLPIVRPTAPASALMTYERIVPAAR
ncbi:MAG: alpha-galactosidase [Tepidisphaeraceae bacterium]